jgi:hypothetical protein
MAPPARYEDISKLVVAEIQPNRALVFARPNVPGSGAFVLDPIDERTTRLIVRGRGADSGTPLYVLYYRGFFEPGHFIMERGQMLGIKALAEGSPSERSLAERISLACSVVAALGLVAMPLSGRRWPWTLLVASVGTSLVTLEFFVWYPSVLLGLLLALAVLAALVWTYRPPATAREHPGDGGGATSTSG